MLPFDRKLLATCGPAAALRVPPWKKIPPYFMSLISVGLLFFSLSCENKWKLYCQEWTVLNLLRTTTWIETWLRETWASSGRNSLCAWLNFKRIFSSSQSHARNFAPRPKVLEGRKWNSFRPGVCKSWLCGTLPWKTPMSLVIVCSLGLAYSQPPWREGPQKHSALHEELHHSISRHMTRMTRTYRIDSNDMRLVSASNGSLNGVLQSTRWQPRSGRHQNFCQFHVQTGFQTGSSNY